MAKISVVIPAYNEEKYIGRTLESLKKQTLKPYEVIVVNNDSRDKTEEVAKSMGAEVVFEKEKSIGAARKAGFEKAQGDIIATTDADTILPKDWLLRMAKTFLGDSRIVALGGTYKFDSPKHQLTVKLISEIWILCDKILNFGNNIPGVNMAVKKEAYNKIGGFRKNYNYYEDLDLSLRLRKIGKTVFLKNLVVITSYRRYAKDGFFKTVFNYMRDYCRLRFRKKDIKMEDVRKTNK